MGRHRCNLHTHHGVCLTSAFEWRGPLSRRRGGESAGLNSSPPRGGNMRSTRREHMYRRGIGTRIQAMFENLESRQLLSGNGATSLAIGNTLFFAYNDGVHGTELWKSNLDGSGKVMIKDIYNALPGSGSNPSWFTNYDGKLYFAASDPVVGRELYTSDGTSNGTH